MILFVDKDTTLFRSS